MQKITLLGNLGKDPEERVTTNGRRVVSFSLAVSPRKNQTVWYECQLWQKRIEIFENILPHLKKGSRILVCGDFHTPELYEKKDGSQGIRLRMEPNYIHFCGAPKQVEKQTPQQGSIFEGNFNEEEIPF